MSRFELPLVVRGGHLRESGLPENLAAVTDGDGLGCLGCGYDDLGDLWIVHLGIA